ncbi:hypothetical protein CEC48_00065 [Pseudomonas sp. K2I15]|nr:hypothetical protein CEC48_00065 [Pseudomonas sp. K2I15]
MITAPAHHREDAMVHCTVIPQLKDVTPLQRLKFQMSLHKQGLKRVTGYSVWTTTYQDELNQAPIAKKVDQALRQAAHHARLPTIAYLVQIGDSPLIRVG